MEVRKELTDEWRSSDVEKPEEFAELTYIMTKEWRGKTTREYKVFKGLKKENMRDRMTNIELVLNMLAEVSAADLSRQSDPVGMAESIDVVIQGGSVAKAAPGKKPYRRKTQKV